MEMLSAGSPLPWLSGSKADHLKARIYLNVYTFVHHWRHHLAETLTPLSAGYRTALEHGDPLFAALNAHVASHHRLFTATHLADAEEVLSANHRAIAKLDQRAALKWTEIFWQMTHNLMGRAADPLALIGDAFRRKREHTSARRRKRPNSDLCLSF